MKKFIKDNKITGADVERIYKRVEEENKKGTFFVDISEKGECPHNDIAPGAADFFKNAATKSVDLKKRKYDINKARMLAEGLV